MNDYIHLESIRLNESFKINIACHGDLESAEIAPLVMLTFLENSFKHGVRDHEPDCWIDMKIDVESTAIRYEISNKKVKHAGNKSLKSGFGLSNVIKRLHLSYPEKHKLEIRDEPDLYHVSLTLSRL
jgi:LytS/YehU family sensor histidine kinase